MAISKRIVEMSDSIIGVGALAAGGFGFLLWHGGVFWAGSVSQVHGVCSAAGPYVALGGMHALTACSDAGTAYFLLIAGLVISIVVALAGIGVRVHGSLTDSDD